MEKITIRKATLDDINTLLRFEQGVIHTERPFDPTLRPDPLHYYDIPELISAPHIEFLVAVSGEELIGSGYARIEEAKPYLQHRQKAYLGFMYVEPQHRGKGINKMIIGGLQEWVQSKGISEMRLDVYVENSAAITAYEKIGFKKHMIEMRKPTE